MLDLFKNGAMVAVLDYHRIEANITTAEGSRGSTIIGLGANDYIEIFVYLTGVSDANLYASENQNYFAVQRLQ